MIDWNIAVFWPRFVCVMGMGVVIWCNLFHRAHWQRLYWYGHKAGLSPSVWLATYECDKCGRQFKRRVSVP